MSGRRVENTKRSTKGGRMAVAILLGGFGLVGAGIVIVAATRGRRDWHGLDDAFTEARGHELDPATAPAPWSSFDLTALRDDAAAIDPRDPFATLKRTSSPISWHVPANGNGYGPKPIAWRRPVETAAR
jgi:hypothetical protein